MGTTVSRCTVVNKATYTVKVDVYDAKDAQGLIAKQCLTLLPGQTANIRFKKAAYLRLSGGGRTQNLIKALPAQVIDIPDVQDQANTSHMPIPASPFAMSEYPGLPQKSAGALASASDDSSQRQYANIPQNAPSWLDERHSNGKDELQQLVRRLEREALQCRSKVAIFLIPADSGDGSPALACIASGEWTIPNMAYTALHRRSLHEKQQE